MVSITLFHVITMLKDATKQHLPPSILRRQSAALLEGSTADGVNKSNDMHNFDVAAVADAAVDGPSL